MSDSNNDFDIAIIGMAGRFPDAENVQEFWKNIENGQVSFTNFDDSELLESGVSADQVGDEDYVKGAPVLKDASRFDAEFFNYSPKEAECIDPQQRQLLETAWHALEDAGYDPSRFDGRIATFAGTAMNSYLLASGLGNDFFNNYLPTLLGSDKDYIATRIAYKLGIRGPAVTVQTACSTSLVAIHMACQSLLNQESDMALVGAAAVRCPLKTGHMYEVGSVFSKDGLCRPFDKHASGTVFGSGVGVVALKRIQDALDDDDNIVAIIKGSAINNDGSTKSDFTAPSINQQAEAVADALASANVDARSISYVEAHGTGTFLGDPIEVEALSRAFRLDTSDTDFCGLGSVKSNIGHLDAAAGIASLIKVAMAMKNGVIPATANFSEPNPQIKFSETPFNLVKKNRNWNVGKNEKLRAGVSSLGMGGTNAHVVLEQHVSGNHNCETDGRAVIVPLSAMTDSALNCIADQLATKLASSPEYVLEDVAYTLQIGRKELDKRKAIVATSISEAVEILEKKRPPAWIGKQSKPRAREVVMMFPGQGSQHLGMARNLASQEGVFRDVLLRADNICEPLIGQRISSFLTGVEDSSLKELINETKFTQPILYTVEYAYATLLHSMGIKACAFVGHSIGEYVAAAMASVFCFEDGLRLVIERGRLMQDAPRGVMMSVPMSELEMTKILPSSLDISVVNSSSSCVVSGDVSEIAEFQRGLALDGYDAQILRTSHAFHSRSMDGAAAAFELFAKSFEFKVPNIPFLSNVTGDYIAASEAVSPAYWASQIRSTVKFESCLETLYDRQATIFVEAGPGTTLSSLAGSYDNIGDHIAVSMAQHPRSSDCEYAVLLRGLALMWTEGYDLDWAKIQTGKGKRVSLPGYPFEGEHYWYSGSNVFSTNSANQLSSTVDRLPQKQWFWKEGWSHVDLQHEQLSRIGKIVLIYHEHEPTELVKSLEASTYTVVPFQFHEENSSIKEFENLFSTCDRTHVIYLADTEVSGRASKSLFSFIKTILGAVDAGDYLNSVDLITTGALAPLNVSSANAEASAFAGVIRVLNHEFSQIIFRMIDLPSGALYKSSERLAERIIRSSCYSVMSYLHNEWWAQFPENVNIPIKENSDSVFLDKDVVVIGAFGGIGRELCRSIVGSTKSLVLGATSFPDEDTWSEIISAGKSLEDISRIEFVSELREKCRDVVVIPTNVCLAGGCKKLRAEIDSKSDAAVDYVFHLAGTIEDSLIALKTYDSFCRVLAPKIDGTRRLARAISSKIKEKYVIFGSTASWLGPTGQVDYASANAFQMAVAKELTEEGVPTVALAWPGWKNTGMMARSDLDRIQTVSSSSTLSADIAVGLIPSLVSVRAGSSITVSPCSLVSMRQEGDIHSSAGITNEAESTIVLAEEQTPSSAKDIINMLWSDALGVSEVSDDDNFFQLGGNSLTLTQVVSKLRKRHKIKIDLKTALANPILSFWVKLLDSSDTDASANTDESIRGQDSTEVFITPGVARFIKRRGSEHLSQWNLATMLVSIPNIDIDILKASLLTLVNHHLMLRGGFSLGIENGLNMYVDRVAVEAPLEILDFENVSDVDLVENIENGASKMQGSLDPASCNLFKAVLFKCGSRRPDRLLLLTHHFISDGLSWTLTLTDFQKIYHQLMNGLEPKLQEPETSYIGWSKYLADISNNEAYLAKVDYWLKQDWSSINNICDPASQITNNLNKTAKAIDFSLSFSVTSDLEQFSSIASLDELAMVALANAISQWRGGKAALLDVVGNGRELNDVVDVTQTVGYFISYTPVIVPVSDLSNLGLAFESSLEKIREMSDLGLTHDLLRYITTDSNVLAKMENTVPESQVLFNYIGRLKENIGDLADKEYWRIAEEQCGALHNSAARRDQPLALRLEVIEGCLDVTLVYSTELHSDDDAAQLLTLFQESLRLLSKSVKSYN